MVPKRWSDGCCYSEHTTEQRAAKESFTRYSNSEWSDSDTLSLRMTNWISGSRSSAVNVSVLIVVVHIGITIPVLIDRQSASVVRNLDTNCG
jgi:hypothetical protein